MKYLFLLTVAANQNSFAKENVNIFGQFERIDKTKLYFNKEACDLKGGIFSPLYDSCEFKATVKMSVTNKGEMAELVEISGYYLNSNLQITELKFDGYILKNKNTTIFEVVEAVYDQSGEPSAPSDEKNICKFQIRYFEKKVFIEEFNQFCENDLVTSNKSEFTRKN